MKRTMITALFTISYILTNGQILSSWNIGSIVTGGITYQKQINPGQPGGNIDFINNVLYELKGNVSLSSAADQDYVVYFKFVNNVGGGDVLNMGTISSGNTALDFDVNWTGNTYGAATGTNLKVYVFFQASGQAQSGLSSNYLTFTPRSVLTLGGATSYTICTSYPVQFYITANGGSGTYTYLWSPATGLSSTSVPNPTATVSKTTVYTVLVTDLSYPAQKATKNVTISFMAAPIVSLTGARSGAWAPCPTVNSDGMVSESEGVGSQPARASSGDKNDSDKMYSLVNEGSRPADIYKPYAIGPGGGSMCTWTASGIPANATAVNWSVIGLSPGLTLGYVYTGSLQTGLVVTGSFPGSGTTFKIFCSYTTPTCTSQSTMTYVQLCNFLPQVQSTISLTTSVYPNPTDKAFSVSINVQDEATYVISIHDAIGSVLCTKYLGALPFGLHEESFNLIQSGIYYVKVFTSDGKTEMHRVLVK